MKDFLFICTRHEAFGIFHICPLSAIPLCLVGYISFCKKVILLEKNDFYDIFQVGAFPNLKDSSLYDRFSIQMYKA